MKVIIFYTSILFLLSSCDPNMVYDDYQSTEGGQWTWADKKIFKVQVTDSLKTYNILINIRHTTQYTKSNLFVFITTIGPNNLKIRDTVEIQVADVKGKWLGNGFGDIKLITRMYRKGVLFRYCGEYTFIIEQGMRLPEIPVTDVGLRLEEYKEPR